MFPLSQLLSGPTDRFYGFQRYLNREGGDPWVSLAFWLLILGACTAVLIIGLRYARFQRWDRSLGYPWRMFYRELWMLPLSWRQRWRLSRVARVVCPEAPLAILLTRSALDRAALAWARTRSRSPEAYVQRTVGPISRAMFG